MSKAIELVETRRGCEIIETHPRYDVLFNGAVYGQLYFNMTGYTGCNLPSPQEDGTVVALHVGERGITAYRKEVARLNRKWAEVRKAKS